MGSGAMSTVSLGSRICMHLKRSQELRQGMDRSTDFKHLTYCLALGKGGCWWRKVDKYLI